MSVRPHRYGIVVFEPNPWSTIFSHLYEEKIQGLVKSEAIERKCKCVEYTVNKFIWYKQNLAFPRLVQHEWNNKKSKLSLYHQSQISN